MVNILSEKRFGDSDRSEPSPRDWSLSFSLVADRRWCESLLGVFANAGREWSSGPVMETTGMGVSRLAIESAASLPMVRYHDQGETLEGRSCSWATGVRWM